MEEFCELFSLFSLLLLTKIFLNGTAGSVSIIFPISGCWKLRQKKTLLLEWHDWEGPFFCPSCFSFPHWRQDKAHVFTIVPAIMVKRNGQALTLPRCLCSRVMSLFGPGWRGTGGRDRVLAAQKEAGATCSSSALISYTSLVMGSSKGGPQQTRQIPAAQRELTARVISCKIFTRGSRSLFCFRFANEAAGNEKIKWKSSLFERVSGELK